ncbi:MAG: hypothetical protein JRI72_00260 [Deltaproteobacteria bacterium]|nr:hypothetical protein [Deltaproteobacteria bacterium]
MDYKKEAEMYLKNYNLLKKAVENLDYEINAIVAASAPNEIKPASISETGIKGSRIEDDTLNKLYRLTELKRKKAKTEDKIRHIDYNLKIISLDEGCENYGELLIRFYLRKDKIVDISEDMHISVPRVYQVRDMALQKFAVALFGLDALV